MATALTGEQIVKGLDELLRLCTGAREALVAKLQTDQARETAERDLANLIPRRDALGREVETLGATLKGLRVELERQTAAERARIEGELAKLRGEIDGLRTLRADEHRLRSDEERRDKARRQQSLADVQAEIAEARRLARGQVEAARDQAQVEIARIDGEILEAQGRLEAVRREHAALLANLEAFLAKR